jgi:hypothetical protein
MLQTMLKNIENTEEIIRSLDEEIDKQTAEFGIEIELLKSIPGWVKMVR